ncbi:hypothetical protein KSP40_PGU007975 [Platanthera guangdongensis]|uniref:Secreted protein n=1 Tax=Platanthera guangdongensis TaxID=2320717 RepID=A0ABR2N0Y3_9ASPA
MHVHRDNRLAPPLSRPLLLLPLLSALRPFRRRLSRHEETLHLLHLHRPPHRPQRLPLHVRSTFPVGVHVVRYSSRRSSPSRPCSRSAQAIFE